MSAIRCATAGDLPELARLRSAFCRELGGDLASAGSDDDWQSTFREVVTSELRSERMRILVADRDGGLAGCGVGTIDQWLPGAHLVDGRVGHVLNVYTDLPWRRRGYSRAIVEQLLTWFGQQRVSRIDLHASPTAEPLYRSLGFSDHPDVSLSWRPDRAGVTGEAPVTPVRR